MLSKSVAAATAAIEESDRLCAKTTEGPYPGQRSCSMCSTNSGDDCGSCGGGRRYATGKSLAAESTAAPHQRKDTAYIGIFDIFKIGLGPSSSHTMGPMWAGKRFAELVTSGLAAINGNDPVCDAAKTANIVLQVHLYGSLALTGKGHATDKATILGLAGFQPDTINPDSAEETFRNICSGKRLLLDGRVPLAFDFDSDVTFHYALSLPLHPNAMTLRAEVHTSRLPVTGEAPRLLAPFPEPAPGAGGDALSSTATERCTATTTTTVYEETYYSLGGGFIKTEKEMLAEAAGSPGSVASDTETTAGASQQTAISSAASVAGEKGGGGWTESTGSTTLTEKSRESPSAEDLGCTSVFNAPQASPVTLAAEERRSGAEDSASSHVPSEGSERRVGPARQPEASAKEQAAATAATPDGLKADGLRRALQKERGYRVLLPPGSPASAPPAVAAPAPTVPYFFQSAAELMVLAKTHQLSIAEIMYENECALKSWTRKQVYEKIDAIAAVIDGCVERGLRMEGRMPISDAPRRAAQIRKRLNITMEKNLNDPLVATDWIALYAMAVNEENACGGRVVTAPTNGASGTLPGVLTYYRRSIPTASKQGVRDFLATAAAIGSLCKRNASISGAEAGCQAEVGSACAMAAAGFAAVLGGTTRQIENAAEIGLEHCLGMTCDPIMGLVQIPCIERNSVAAVKAVMACRLALMGDGTHNVSLDSCIETMYRTGLDMQAKYRETSTGGLAIFAKKFTF